MIQEVPILTLLKVVILFYNYWQMKFLKSIRPLDLSIVIMERIRIKRANPMQIALPYYCKIESEALSKDSITEKNSAIATDGKN